MDADPTLTQLRAFESTYRLRSISAASHELSYSQPALSRQISTLEEILRTTLFIRSGAGVEPTNAANLLQDHVRILLARLDRTFEDLAAIQESKSRTLSVGAPPSINAEVIPLAISKLMAIDSIGEVAVHENTSPEILEKLRHTEYDFGVITHYPIMGPLDLSGVEYIKLHTETLLCALPINYSLAELKSVDLELLADTRWIESYSPTMAVLSHACRAAGYEPLIEINCGSWLGKLGFVAAGMGVALVPQVLSRLQRGKIVVRPLREPIYRELYLCTPKHSTSLQLVRTFGGFLREALNEIAGKPL